MKLIDLFEINSIISPSRSLHLNGEDSDWKTRHCLIITRPESQGSHSCVFHRHLEITSLARLEHGGGGALRGYSHL